MVTIEEVSVEDLKELQLIAKLTFIETYAEYNTPENLNDYLRANFNPKQLATELKNKESKFFFAIDEKEVVGYLKLNFGNAQTDLSDQNSLEIERIYVREDQQGKRIGQALYTKALIAAQKLKASFLWLGVWENNTRAIGFYEKMGFKAFDNHSFTFGNDEQNDILMKMEIG